MADARRAKLAAPIALLKGWDDRWGADSEATSLAVFWGGSAKQFIDLRLGRRGAPYAALCAGFIWLFPC